jgi:hypothetical protein
MLTLSIRGLSVVANRGAFYEVLLNPAMGHVATLTVATAFLRANDVPPRERLNPDLIGYVPVWTSAGLSGYQQVAIWNVTGKRIEFPGSSGPPGSWANRREAIDLEALHAGSKTIAAPSGFGVVRLDQGTPSSELLAEFTLVQEGRDTRRACATEVRWRGLPEEMRVDGHRIQLGADADAREPVAVVGNLAPEPDLDAALGHFHHYYDVTKRRDDRDIPDAARVRLRRRADEVYDCVPPAGGSPP